MVLCINILGVWVVVFYLDFNFVFVLGVLVG